MCTVCRCIFTMVYTIRECAAVLVCLPLISRWPLSIDRLNRFMNWFLPLVFFQSRFLSFYRLSGRRFRKCCNEKIPSACTDNPSLTKGVPIRLWWLRSVKREHLVTAYPSASFPIIWRSRDFLSILRTVLSCGNWSTEVRKSVCVEMLATELRKSLINEEYPISSRWL